MAYLALIAQGVSLLGSFVGSSGPSSAQLQMEIINQLNEVNANLVRTNSILIEVAKKIEQIPEKDALFRAKMSATKIELELDIILGSYQPDGISVTDPDKHYARLIKLYSMTLEAAKSIRAVLVHTKNIEHAMVDISYPIISIMENLRLLSGLLCFPAWLVQLMNSDGIRLTTDFEPIQKLTPEEYQNNLNFIGDTYKEIVADYGPDYLKKIASSAKAFADEGGSMPGCLRFSGCGYRQERYNTLLRTKTWVTHRTTFFREIELPSGFGPVRETQSNKDFEFNITLDGDVARRDWREPYEQMRVKFKHFGGRHRNAQRLNKGQINAFQKVHREIISRDPRNYKSQFRNRLKFYNMGHLGGGKTTPATERQVHEVLSQVYYLEKRFKDQQDHDLHAFYKSSKLEESYQSAVERISIYIYMTGIVNFLAQRMNELNEGISTDSLS